MIRVTYIAAAILALVASGCSESADALADRGLVAARSGRLPEAISLFEEALTTDERHAKARYNLGIAFMERGDAEKAATQFRTFVDERPEDSLGHFSLARAELKAGRQEAALRALRDSVLYGFSDAGALSAAGFDILANDIRYVQLEAVVAQRDDRPAPSETAVEFPGRTSDGYGSERLGQAVPLPGTRINAPNCADGEGAAACMQL